MNTIQNPLISVILPVFNSASTIQTCLQSVLLSTYQNLEILVVYLKSQDNSLDKIQQIHDSRIHIISQLEKTGPGGARNLGLEEAQGQYIGFIEADDTIAPDFYEQLLNAITQDDSDIAWGNIVVNNQLADPFPSQRTISDFYSAYSLIKYGGCFDKLFRSSFIKQFRFAERCRWEDNPLILRAFFMANQISLVPNAQYFYNPTPWQPDYYQRLRQDLFPIATDMMNFINQYSSNQKEKNLVKRKIYDCFARAFIQDHDVYQRLSQILGHPLFLIKDYYHIQWKLFKSKFHRRKNYD